MVIAPWGLSLSAQFICLYAHSVTKVKSFIAATVSEAFLGLDFSAMALRLLCNVVNNRNALWFSFNSISACCSMSCAWGKGNCYSLIKPKDRTLPLTVQTSVVLQRIQEHQNSPPVMV